MQTNARLYAETQQAAEELAHLVEAQRSLSAIAAQISAIRDPSVVLQRTVDEARRLLGADLATSTHSTPEPTASNGRSPTPRPISRWMTWS